MVEGRGRSELFTGGWWCMYGGWVVLGRFSLAGVRLGFVDVGVVGEGSLWGVG